MKNLSPKEAITVLKGMKVDIPVPKAAVTQIKKNLALDMAINALNCSEIPNNSDTISRQDAIDAADRADYFGLAVEDVKKVTDEVVKEIKKLPSAEPKRNGWVHIDDVYRLISGHSNYHGDNILATLTCLAEGKEVLNPIDVLEPPERKTGRWLCSDDLYEYAICSCCKWEGDESWEYITQNYGYCPHCGAKMEEQGNEVISDG